MQKKNNKGVIALIIVLVLAAAALVIWQTNKPETQQGGMEALTEHLADPAFRETLKARMLTGSDFENITHLVGFENVVPISLHTEEYKPFEGKSLAEIAEHAGITRQGVRDQINNYMRTVMGEEPVDPSLEVLHDEESW